MATVKPFTALTYNREKIKDFSKVITPPYDVISPARQDYFYNLDPHNFIRILLRKDVPAEDKYASAGQEFSRWQQEGIFTSTNKPAFYFYSHEYEYRREKKIRLGFIGLLGLDSERTSVFGHEHTHKAPKDDRLNLLRKVRANLSPIFVLFPDQKRIIQRIYQQNVIGNKPFIEARDDDQGVHRLWKIDHPDAVYAIESSLADERIFIADGHHRYEVACLYRQEMKQQGYPGVNPEELEYLMAYFTNTESKGLTVLPIHRLVELGVPFDFERFTASVKDFFEVEIFKDQRRFFFLLEKGGRNEHLLGVYGGAQWGLLRLRNVKILDKIINDKPAEYRALDVAILNYLVLKKAMGIEYLENPAITFSPEAQELVKCVDKNERCVAFFLNPVRVESIMRVALAGTKMPPKSTFFYPKVASGLVINKFSERKS